MGEELFSDLSETICAVSTPHGSGGIAVIRISGKKALEITDKVWKGKALTASDSHTAHFGELTDAGTGEPIDQCVATVFKGPHSYTGENTVELSVHGAKWIQREALKSLCRAGARMAARGEFTRRAVINGRLDLSQAEGVADLIAASSRAAHRVALSQVKGSVSRTISDLRDKLVKMLSLLELELDFSEEDVEFADRSELLSLAETIAGKLRELHCSYAMGATLKEGIPVAIVGATNAGKSSLLNALIDEDRAIVSEIHGTTRDTIEETCEIGDYRIRFIDTAGIRPTDDPIEKAGIERSISSMKKARIVLHVIDSTIGDDVDNINTDCDTGSRTLIRVYNKVDLLNDPAKRNLEESLGKDGIMISARTHDGIKELKSLILSTIEADGVPDENDIVITNLRQATAIESALDSITPVIDDLKTIESSSADPMSSEYLSYDLISYHLRETISHLSSLTGEITPQEVLNNIFSSFCIGK